MIFHEFDKLENLRAGDTLVLSDGTKHEAVVDREFEGCIDCSISKISICRNVS